ncbi:hypothetical protein APS_0732 [Acetobacter pasteurianus subsp. pasteurianus LMG 1262 = NBRC 106471]|nr:hypothetical protein APS_0732 [Acetobacter pasteurianus subsp. pasteurianus LMG 1262 = NBRC 106471]
MAGTVWRNQGLMNAVATYIRHVCLISQVLKKSSGCALSCQDQGTFYVEAQIRKLFSVV